MALRLSYMLLALLLLPLTAPSQERLEFGEEWQLDRNWQVEMGEPYSDARFFGVFGLRLFAVANSEEGPQIWLMDLRGGKPGETVLPFATDGLPSDMEVTAFEAHYATRNLLLAGLQDGRVVAYRAPLSPRAEPLGEWTPIREFPEQHEERVVEIRSYDDYAIFFTDRMMSGRPVLAGWAARFDVQEEELFRWIELPSPKRAREGFTPFFIRDQAIIAGGTVDDPQADDHGEPAVYPEFLRFSGAQFGTWEPTAPAVPRHLTDVVGTSYGAGLFLAARQPADEATSQTLRVSADLGGGRYSPWNEATLEARSRPVRGLAIDPANSHLIVITEAAEANSLFLTSYTIPSRLTAKRPTRDEALLAHWQQNAPVPVQQSMTELLQRAEKEGKMALAVVVDDSEDQDVRVRSSMGTSRYRYMTLNAVSSYFKGAAGRELLREHGITETPAYILLDSSGKMVQHHSGSIPSSEELFRLTSPTRAPIGVE